MKGYIFLIERNGEKFATVVHKCSCATMKVSKRNVSSRSYKCD